MFSPMWRLLEQEGYLAQSCLCTGLTALRAANLGDQKGLFYSAFFELSIGLERMMKLIVILDHLAEHMIEAPPAKTIEAYGHKLLVLWRDVQRIATKLEEADLDSLAANALLMDMLQFLDEFAHPGGRYANINKLTGSNLQGRTDPMDAWAVLAGKLFELHATRAERAKAAQIKAVAQIMLGDVSMNLINDLSGASLGVGGLHQRASELDTAGRYAVWYFVQLTEALRKVLDGATYKAHQAEERSGKGRGNIPFMGEFFEFAWSDKTYALRKKVWP